MRGSTPRVLVVLAFDEFERAVNALADVRLRSRLQQPGLVAVAAPTRARRYEEHVVGDVLVLVVENILAIGGVLDVAVAVWIGKLGEQLGPALLEALGNVFQEEKAKDEVLVLGGVHAAAQNVSGLE